MLPLLIWLWSRVEIRQILSFQNLLLLVFFFLYWSKGAYFNFKSNIQKYLKKKKKVKLVKADMSCGCTHNPPQFMFFSPPQFNIDSTTSNKLQFKKEKKIKIKNVFPIWSWFVLPIILNVATIYNKWIIHLLNVIFFLALTAWQHEL